MITELRAKSQITLPKSIVSSLGISEGDKLEIFDKRYKELEQKMYSEEVVSDSEAYNNVMKEIRYYKKDNGKFYCHYLLIYCIF